MKLTAKNVHDTFTSCLCQDKAYAESPDVVIAESLQAHRFNRDLLDKNKAGIGEMLSELPSEFYSSGGGGWSFLNACMTSSGEHWGEQRSVEMLLALGIATGQAKILFPRDIWPVLPGGVPYFSVL